MSQDRSRPEHSDPTPDPIPPSQDPRAHRDGPHSSSTPHAASSHSTSDSLDSGQLSEDQLGISRDITPLLAGWSYEPGTINVRKIVGSDGRPKLQMRVDLGLLQMEVNGRPDGVRPHGHESLLDYYERQLEQHRQANGSDIGFHLTRPQCESLRHEAAMYYQRYLSLFVLEEYSGVIRDTSRNLRLLDLCFRFAADEQDRLWLEQYRPYILMMQTRASASLLVRDNRIADAYRITRKALRRIRNFFTRFQQPDAYNHSSEVRTLKKLARDLKSKLPIDPLKQLQKELDAAIRAERYEQAAQLRDQITRLTPPK